MRPAGWSSPSPGASDGHPGQRPPRSQGQTTRGLACRNRAGSTPGCVVLGRSPPPSGPHFHTGLCPRAATVHLCCLGPGFPEAPGAARVGVRVPVPCPASPALPLRVVRTPPSGAQGLSLLPGSSHPNWTLGTLPGCALTVRGASLLPPTSSLINKPGPPNSTEHNTHLTSPPWLCPATCAPSFHTLEAAPCSQSREPWGWEGLKLSGGNFMKAG